jgi:GxxExxY protein
MLRVQSPLDDVTEAQITVVIDCALEVHRTLGPGFIESVYHNALCLELESRDIQFETERTVVVRYREKPVGVHRLDLVVQNAVVVELKAVKCLDPAHHAQVLSYLKATGYRVGLLMNFGGTTLGQGLRRIVL